MVARSLSFLFILGVFLFPVNVSGQTQAEEDSLVAEMCETLKGMDGSDSARMKRTLQVHLIPYMKEYPKDRRREVFNNVYFRFAHECIAFAELLDRIGQENKHWTVLEEKPETTLDPKICKTFKVHDEFTYLLGVGDTVQVRIKDGKWLEEHMDGTYSHLRMKWENACTFVLVFIKSDNTMKKGFSEKGDRYRYRIHGKKDGFYEMSLEQVGKERYMKFKLYY